MDENIYWGYLLDKQTCVLMKMMLTKRGKNMLKVTKIEEGLLVQIPYMPKVNAALKRLGEARYSHDHKGWIMQPCFEGLIKEKLIHYFGAYDDELAEKVDVEVTFKQGVEVTKRPVSVAGRVFARAHGRDTGAATGEGVALLDGSITSGGSNKTWSSIVKAGAKFRVVDLYLGLLQEFENKPDQYEVEIKYEFDESFSFVNFMPIVPDDLLIQECIERGLQIPN